MQIVIEMPEKTYEYYAKLAIKGEQLNNLEKIILDGVPLPKGHGRLIDADAIDWFKGEDENGIPCYILDKRDLSLEPTIIEAN